MLNVANLKSAHISWTLVERRLQVLAHQSSVLCGTRRRRAELSSQFSGQPERDEHSKARTSQQHARQAKHNWTHCGGDADLLDTLVAMAAGPACKHNGPRIRKRSIRADSCTLKMEANKEEDLSGARRPIPAPNPQRRWMSEESRRYRRTPIRHQNMNSSSTQRGAHGVTAVSPLAQHSGG